MWQAKEMKESCSNPLAFYVLSNDVCFCVSFVCCRPLNSIPLFRFLLCCVLRTSSIWEFQSSVCYERSPILSLTTGWELPEANILHLIQVCRSRKVVYWISNFFPFTFYIEIWNFSLQSDKLLSSDHPSWYIDDMCMYISICLCVYTNVWPKLLIHHIFSW